MEKLCCLLLASKSSSSYEDIRCKEWTSIRYLILLNKLRIQEIKIDLNLDLERDFNNLSTKMKRRFIRK